MKFTEAAANCAAAAKDLAFFDSGRRLAVLFDDGMLHVVDVNSSTTVRTISAAPVESDGRFVGIGCAGADDLYLISDTWFVYAYSTKEDGELTLKFKEQLKMDGGGCRPICCATPANHLFVVAAEIGAACRETLAADGESSDDEDDSYRIVFYHVKENTARVLGCYKECHSGLVTRLAARDHFLMSGGDDGLVNVYDLRQPTEDDALLHSFNCASSISTCNFFGVSSDCLNVYAVTDDGAAKAWTINDGDELFSIADNSRTNSDLLAFFVDCFVLDDKEVRQIFSDASGKIGVTKFDDKTKVFRVISEDKQAHRDLVRCAAWSNETRRLATGGDDGRVILWTFDEDEERCEERKNKSSRDKNEAFPKKRRRIT